MLYEVVAGIPPRVVHVFDVPEEAMYGYARIESEPFGLGQVLVLYKNQYDPAVDHASLSLSLNQRSLAYSGMSEMLIMAIGELVGRCPKHGLDGFYFEEELYEVPKKITAPPPKAPKVQRPKHNRIRRI